MVRAKYWFMTLQVENLRKAKLTEEQIGNPEYVCKFLSDVWKKSGKDRNCCISFCVSKEGLRHVHGALISQTTSMSAVMKTMFNAHIEVCRGGKGKLLNYILKEGEYSEKGEEVLYVIGKETIASSPGKRTDFDVISDLIEEGYSPKEIMEENFPFRKYEHYIKNAYIDKKIGEAPIRKNIWREYHVGESGSGKTYVYEKLCLARNPDEIFFTGYMTNGWIDDYMTVGAPPTLFIDDLKASGTWQELLNILDVYTRRAIHARYKDVYPLWTEVYITSIYPPEELYTLFVKSEYRQTDSIQQLLRRLDVIVYHYVENGEYKEYRMPASEYINYEHLKECARNNVDFENH